MGMGLLKLCVTPQPYVTFPRFTTWFYLSEISQIRHLLQEKGGSLQAPWMQERPHGINAMRKCADKFRRGRKVSVPHEIPLHSTAAPRVHSPDPVNCVMSFQDRKEAAAPCRKERVSCNPLTAMQHSRHGLCPCFVTYLKKQQYSSAPIPC